MKKIYYLRLWLIAAMLSIAYSASAYDVEVNGIYYNLDDNAATASVTQGDGKYVGEVVIPSEIKVDKMRYTVTSIGDYAFYVCSGLTSVTIPNSVTKIGDSAFYVCSGLTSVIIPNSVTTIDYEAFGYCSNLISLTIPDSVTEIGMNAFLGTAWFINQPDGLVYIGKILYQYKGNMPDNTSIAIKDGTNIIAGGAFYDCSGLTSVTIPNSVTKIGGGAFYNCRRLTSITIPNSVTEIEDYVFSECASLTSVTIPNSVTKIGDEAFYYCHEISKITIPKTVKTIGSSAFACNDNLEVYVEWDNLSPELLSFDQQPFSYGIMQYGTLYVPTGTKALYEQTEPWKNFVTILEYTVDGIEEIEVEGGVTIGVEGGKIVVNGAGDAKVEVFGTNGAAMYSGLADTLPELTAGIYVVRVGSIIKKVAVTQ